MPVGAFVVDVGDRDVRAARDEPTHARFAQSRRTAGDDDTRTFEIHAEDRGTSVIGGPSASRIRTAKCLSTVAA